MKIRNASAPKDGLLKPDGTGVSFLTGGKSENGTEVGT